MGQILNRRRVMGGKSEKMILATLTLTDDSVVVINGEGTLTAAMVADYMSTCKYFVAGAKCTSIGGQVFRGCSSLTSVEIPDSVTSIGSYAFDGCRNLTSIITLNSVVTIGSYAFRRTSIQEVFIGSGITSIYTATFYNCRQLAQVTILSVTPPTLRATVFDGNKEGRKIYVPSESIEAYKTADGWSTYAADIEAIPT